MKHRKKFLLAAASAIALGASAPGFAAGEKPQSPTVIKPDAAQAKPQVQQKMEPKAGNDTAQMRNTGPKQPVQLGSDWVAAELTSNKDLIGADVVNSKNETIGEVETVVSVEGRQQLIVSIGEFLGIGGRSVAIDLQEAQVFHHRNDMDELRVHTDMTEDQLKALPEYNR